ncbi:MAG: MBOAT family O-acyltransferase [Myxococcales bacterium]
MLFNSYAFIFAFLPVALAGFFAAARWAGAKAALGFLVAASGFFYGWWNPRYLLLIALSIAVNFVLGTSLAKTAALGPVVARRARLWLGVAFNLGLLGYYKYANFVVDTVNWTGGWRITVDRIVLPLAISFFTFQQIAFLVDAWRGKARPYRLHEYTFLVTFFPHLIAGPIVQHGDLLSQLTEKVFRPDRRNLAIGASYFVIGLFKKVVVADSIAPWVGPVYDAHGGGAGALLAWQATVAYSLQLYFDFSGYSDMAIGLARLFNFRFPVNFNSPYKATSVIDFWRRWHMSLSRFLREYLYFSLGGGRRGPVRRYTNLMLTMLLGGLWHGAGWGFVLWGGLNGLFLMVNHGFRWLRGAGESEDDAPRGHWLATEASVLLTFVAIMFSRVFFRAPDLDSALAVLKSLLGFGPEAAAVASLAPWLVLVGLWIACRVLPNSQELLAGLEPQATATTTRLSAAPAWLRWSLTPRWAAVTALLAGVALLNLDRVSAFLYFQF